MSEDRRYGWRRGLIDTRDWKVSIPRAAYVPSSVDHRSLCPPILDQGPIGSCTAHGILVPAGYAMNKHNPALWKQLSRLQLYWWSRFSEDTQNADSGAVIRDVIKVLAAHGAGSEDYWPYDVSKMFDQPPQEAEDDAPSYKAQSYASVDNSPFSVKTALSGIGPVVFGMTVYDSFEGPDVASTGIVPMPAHGEATMGGHCMALVGYGQKPGYFTVQNSWGSSWGDGGYCYLPEEYLATYASDLWTISMFGSDAAKTANAL